MGSFPNGEDLCLLCNNPKLYTHTGDYASNISRQVLPSCIAYLPDDITKGLKISIPAEVKRPIFCKICFESCFVLSRLSSQLESIQTKINKQVAEMIVAINKAKISHSSKKLSSTSTSGKKRLKSNPNSTNSKKSNIQIDSTAKSKSTSRTAEESNSEEFVNSKMTKTKRPILASVLTCPSDDTTISLKCDECGRLFSSKSGLTKHKSYHKGCTCATCGKLFSSWIDKQMHMQTHQHKTSTSTLKTYAKRENFSKIIYRCRKCGVNFDKATELAMHNVNIHGTSANKFLNCKICQKLLQAEDLGRHMLEHSKGTHPKIETVRSCANVDQKLTVAPNETKPIRNVEDDYILGKNSCWQQDEDFEDVDEMIISDLKSEPVKIEVHQID